MRFKPLALILGLALFPASALAASAHSVVGSLNSPLLAGSHAAAAALRSPLLHHAITPTARPGVAPQSVPVSSGQTYYVSPAGTASLSASSSNAPMSLQTALTSAPAGATVHLAAGSYAAPYVTTTRTGWATFTGAGDATAPTIDGIDLFGARFVRFTNVEFTGEFYVNQHPSLKQAQPAQHIAVLNSEFNCGSTTTGPFTQAIFVRGGSTDVTFSGDDIHNCVVGFGSMAQDPTTSDVTITHDTFQNLTGDAIDLAGLNDVVIDHDVVSHIADPQNWYHNDGIQFFGNVSNVSITNNVLDNSRDQLLFIQDAVKSGVTGNAVNSNIVVANNLIYGAGGYAVQDQGGQNVSFVNNTIWDNHWGGMLLEQSSYTGLNPSVKLVDNIVAGLVNDAGTPTREDYNLLAGEPTTFTGGAHDLINVDPHFTNVDGGDFQLVAGSPGYQTGNAGVGQALTSSVAGLGAMFDPTTTMSDMGVFQPTDPSVAYGAPVFGPAPLL
jgi:Right handed beta helix region